MIGTPHPGYRPEFNGPSVKVASVLVVFIIAFIALFATGCGDTIVDVPPAEESSLSDKYDGRWTGTGFEDDDYQQLLGFTIGVMDGTGRRAIGGDVTVVTKRLRTKRSYALQASYLTFTDTEFHAYAWVSNSNWSIRGRLVGKDQLEINIDSYPGQTYMLTRKTTFPKK